MAIISKIKDLLGNTYDLRDNSAIHCDDEELSTTIPINADTLEGHSSDYFQPKDIMPSYVGMITQNYYCDTLEKMRNVFGTDTTWERLDDMFLVGAGNLYPIGNTGGEAEHTLTKDELPDLHGTLPHIAYGEGKVSGNFKYTESGSVYGLEGAAGSIANNSCYVFDVGNYEAHNNLPPYYAIYTWIRTA